MNTRTIYGLEFYRLDNNCQSVIGPDFFFSRKKAEEELETQSNLPHNIDCGIAIIKKNLQ